MGDIERLGFGCVQLTAFSNAGRAQALLDGVFDLGIRHFDTAPVYGQGYSEQIVGRFLKGRRERVTLATKFGLRPAQRPSIPPEFALPLNALRRRLRPPSPGGSEPSGVENRPPPPNIRRITKADIELEFEASCRAMNVDYIDLYLLHEHIPSSLDDEALQHLFSMRKSGQVRQLGLAANGDNYLRLLPSDLEGWDVLQYEGGPAWPSHATLLERFPAKTHVFHSCFKSALRSNPETFGSILTACLSENPRGKVIFGSKSLKHVEANLRAIGA